MTERIKLLLGDISKTECDVIVNAANSTLLGGGGVDGSIHLAAGPRLVEECSKLNGCETGDAKITAGYNLPAKSVIHTVGPIWRGGHRDEHQMLAQCYKRSLALAKETGAKTIAFPAISTGAYRFPPEQAANIAITEIRRFLATNSEPEEVLIVLYDDENLNVYRDLLSIVNNNE